LDFAARVLRAGLEIVRLGRAARLPCADRTIAAPPAAPAPLKGQRYRPIRFVLDQALGICRTAPPITGKATLLIAGGVLARRTSLTKSVDDADPGGGGIAPCYTTARRGGVKVSFRPATPLKQNPTMATAWSCRSRSVVRLSEASGPTSPSNKEPTIHDAAA
jgi:hypothetical protein